LPGQPVSPVSRSSVRGTQPPRRYGQEESWTTTRTSIACGLNPLRWIAYAYGAGLPPRYRTWVLHDVTTRTWVLRHITRSLVQFAPFAIVLFLVIPVDRVILGVGLGMGR
jgi:hypothetical protein